MYRILADHTVEVDSAEEFEKVLLIKDRLSREGRPSVSPPIVAATPSTRSAEDRLASTEEECATQCICRLKDNPTSFLYLLQSQNEVDLDEATSLLGLPNNLATSGVVSGTIRCLKTAGVDPQKIFTIVRTGAKAERKVRYVAGPLLMRLPPLRQE